MGTLILACINEDKYRNDIILKERNKDRHWSFLHDFIKSALFLEALINLLSAPSYGPMYSIERDNTCTSIMYYL